MNSASSGKAEVLHDAARGEGLVERVKVNAGGAAIEQFTNLPGRELDAEFFHGFVIVGTGFEFLHQGVGELGAAELREALDQAGGDDRGETAEGQP